MENKSTHRLSIGLPVYNGEHYLMEALDTLLSQTFSDFELIISDNASTDRTQEICEAVQACDPRVRYVRNDTNIGAARNFNQVFDQATGEYFKWAACDDRLDPRFLEMCIRVLDRDPTVILAYSKSTRINEYGQITGTYDFPMRVDSPSAHIRFRDLIQVNHFCIAIFGVMRREPLRTTPLIGAFVGSDRTLLAELGLKGRLYEVQEYLFHRRDHPQASGRLYKVYKRLAWFDPMKRKTILLPYWHVGLTYLLSVMRVPLPFGERIRCIWPALTWFVKRRKFLIEDLKAIVLQLFPSTRHLAVFMKVFSGK